MYVYRIAIAVLSFLNKRLAAAAEAQAKLARQTEEACINVERETQEKVTALQEKMHFTLHKLSTELDQFEADARKAKALSDKIAGLVN